MSKTEWIPKGAIKITPKAVNAETYLTEYNGRLYAMGFSGNRQKPDFNGRFTTVQFRERYIGQYIERIKRIEERRAERSAERKAFQHTLKVGDILRTSWGYDQTNIDFYQVVELRGKCNIVIRETAQDRVETTGRDTWTTIPRRNVFRGAPMVKRAQQGNSVRIASYAMAYPWSGKPENASTGH